MRRVELDPQLIAEMYVQQNMTLQEIAKSLHRTGKTVLRAFLASGVPMRPRGPRDAAHCRKCAYETIRDKQGYLLRRRPEHPRANSRGYVREHILVMEQKIGRPILPTEDVHHKDENKANNDPDNLDLFASRGEHIRHHNNERSSARAFRALPDAEMRRLYDQFSTPQLAEMWNTSPASIQRELVRRGMSLGQGKRPAGADRRRKRPAQTPTPHPPPESGAPGS